MCTEIRKFQSTDLDGYLQLYNTSEKSDPDFRKLTTKDVHRIVLDHPHHDPEGHFVAVDSGRIVANGRGVFVPEHAKVRGPVAYFELYVLPEYLGEPVERDIFRIMVDHLKYRGAEWITTRVDTRYEARVNQLERLGFTKTSYQNHGMERSPSGIEEPIVPTGYRVRTARVPEENETMVNVFNEAFATRKKYPAMTMERFTKSWIFDDPANHSGFFLAERENDGRVVGMVMTGINHKFNEEHGTKRGGTYSLAVIPSERRRGLGTFLTLKSLKWIADKGMDVAYVSVNVANEDALKIYQAAGYKTVQVYQGYQLRLA
ncbi:MAG: GNAT family N-acetyltransferase [Methanobacteriota archaeon]|nr:MAG: GNAT family N-acetyltransferase [Euryarchaeota archaeon]